MKQWTLSWWLIIEKVEAAPSIHVRYCQWRSPNFTISKNFTGKFEILYIPDNFYTTAVYRFTYSDNLLCIINIFISTSNISSEPFLYLLIVSQTKLVFTMVTNHFGWTQYILIMICFCFLVTSTLTTKNHQNQH